MTRLGPLRLATFVGGRGFVSYRDLDGADADTIDGWVGQALDHYRSDPQINRVEWKTRGHDQAPGLYDSLIAHGFVADESESIMIGRAADLAVEVDLPDGVGLRRITAEEDVRAMIWAAELIFGDPPSEERSNTIAESVLGRLAREDGTELWVAERARAAIRLGKSLINSDSTEDSRPILERSGLVKVSTTTPYRCTLSG